MMTKPLIYKGREVDTQSLDFGRFDFKDENPWLEGGYWADGERMSDSDMDDIADDMASELHMIFMERMY
jgi:hypothetical protein